MELTTSKNIVCYCTMLRRANNIMTNYYNQSLNKHGITITQYSLLNDIYELNASNKTQLANYTGLDRTTIVRNIQLLEKKGLVKNSQSKDDHLPLVSLTTHGTYVFYNAKKDWSSLQLKIESLIDTNNLADIAQSIKKLEE